MNSISLIAVILINFICTGSCSADELKPNSLSPDSLKKSPGALVISDIRIGTQNTLAVFTSPAHFGLKGWLLASAALGATALSFAVDENIYGFMISHQTPSADRLIQPWQWYGYFPIEAGFSGAMYIAGLGFSQPWLRETGRDALTSLFLAGLITTTLKVGLGRSRPSSARGPFKFGFFELDKKSWSFPSGHTSTSFALSTVLASRISNPFATAALYTVAFLTASQRVYSGFHWLSDVALGASIGTTVGYLVTNDNKTRTNYSSNWSVTPCFSGGKTGINAGYSF